MREFKPGDQVKFIETLPAFPISVGENYTPFLIKIIGFPGSFLSSRFELIDAYFILRSDYV